VGSLASLDVTGALTVFWASTGLRALRLERDTYLFPYVEAGIWFWANVGVGYTVGAMGPRVVRHNLHLFLGLPIPIPADRAGWARDLFVIEPYYRPQFGLSSSTGPHRFIHEVGLLFKWHIDLDQARRRRVR
jgi:hypothetical protein